MKTLILTHTIKSNSHNSSYTSEQGQHWPQGTQFKLLPKYRQTHFGKVALEQIGGEEVCLLVPHDWINKLFVQSPLAVYRCDECGKSWTAKDDPNGWQFGHDCEV